MVILNKIYTRTGDDGSTKLSSGESCLKCDIRIAAIGAIDEANSCIGLARSYLTREKRNTIDDMEMMLAHIQNDLFDLGADLATPGKNEETASSALRVTQVQIIWLEKRIDQLNKHLLPLRSFILPGGTVASSALHLARATVRRAERSIVQLSQEKQHINAEAIKYVNRLSDLLFIAGRILNDNGKSDILWIPAANR